MTQPADRLRMIERGYLRGRMVFERPAVWVSYEAIAQLGEEHARAMAEEGTLDMVELEFPDLPEHDRFYRIGTNPAGMVLPVALNLSRKYV